MSAYADAIARREKAAVMAKQASDPINCPMCDGALDTGFECTECGFDATPTLEGTCRMIPQPEVQQVDRDAAAELLGGAAPDGLLDGRQDTLSLVRTLARHRAAAFEAGRAEGVREAAEVADGMLLYAAQDIATAIRALSKEPIK